MRRKLPIALLAFATAFATAMPIALAEEPGTGELGQNVPVVEDGEYNSYIVVMEDDPLVAEIPQDSLDGAAAQAAAAELEESHDAAMTEAGLDTGDIVNSYVNSLNGFSALITHAEAEKLAATSKVALVIPDELLQYHTDSSPEFIGLTGRGGAYAAGYTGKGVVVGIIDTGIWPEHPSFADDGTLPQPAALPLDESVQSACDFGNTAANPEDDDFTCNNKLIGARRMMATYDALNDLEDNEFGSARDDDGHGTHTASTAAGNADVEAVAFGEEVGTISGIAPDAHIIAYKGLGVGGGFTSDLAAAIDQAVADGVDVINYSIGGGANLIGLDEFAFLFAADAGVFVATSAGNEGPGPETVGSPAVAPWITAVGANTQERFFQGRVTVSSDSSRRFRRSFAGASLTLGTDGRFPLVDAEFAGGDLCIPGTLDPAVVEGAIVLCRRGAVGRADKSFAVFDAGGVGMVLYNESDDDNLFTDPHSVPSVHIDLTPGLELKEYIAENTNPVAKISTGNVTRWRSAPGMTIFSSRGPNPVAPDIIKPDVTAPGLQILAGASPNNVGYVQGELFQAIAGTSMSSPHVAGVFALIKQAHPDWSAAVAKSALMTTADTDVVDNDRETQANPFEMGAGMIDPGGSRRGSAFDPGLAYDAGFFEYVGFLCDAAPEAVSAAFCASLEAGGIPTLAYNLNVPSIGVSEVPGTRTILRTVTNVSDRSLRVEAEVKKPKGFDVTVSPKRLNIPAGGSATFEVTFTTTNAPIGEWRFGSLTWEGSGYEVRSPIAVRAAQIEAPESVSGSGVDGAASFEVLFGYTGAYSAAAHGLVPALLTVDNVLQDGPEDPAEFSPGDVATGGANAHTFDLTGAAVFKIAMPPEAAEANSDIDIYVYNPNNQLVAASTAGGTDEEIIIESPMAGIWTVYVHGWEAPGGDSDYTMYSWVISATPGGSLAIDSAPTAATSGATGTLNVSWTGATDGQWHLGAVSHHDEDSQIGLTFVEVDNRP